MKTEIRFQITSKEASAHLAEWCRNNGLKMRRCTLVEDSDLYAVQVMNGKEVIATVVAAPWCREDLSDVTRFIGAT